jgi:hypothetical protein
MKQIEDQTANILTNSAGVQADIEVRNNNSSENGNTGSRKYYIRYSNYKSAEGGSKGRLEKQVIDLS